MQLEKLNFEETGLFSNLFLDYLSEQPKIRDFYRSFPRLEAFAEAIDQKGFNNENRPVLVDALNRQYEGLAVDEAVKANLELLKKDNTYTVTTGHQLNLCSGPLYFIYKIVTTINACKRLKDEYPDHNFVPVYWMATEDHDFAEINHFHLFGNKYQWETDQTGPVGRFQLNGVSKMLVTQPSR